MPRLLKAISASAKPPRRAAAASGSGTWVMTVDRILEVSSYMKSAANLE